MQDHSLVYPMFAMVVLTATTLGRLFRSRVASVQAGTTDPRYFKIYQDGGEPVASAQLSRNFSNLLEAPTLFYVGCLAAMISGQTSALVTALAWLYVAARVLHTIVHTGSNRLNARIAAYFTSWAILLTLWGAVALGVATSR